jgi:hypothetical protein
METKMTREEIKSGNALIAEFVDLTPHGMFSNELQAPDEFGWMAVRVNVAADYLKEDGEFESFEHLFEFHSSWDWLMPVVEKIENIDIRNNGYDFPKVKLMGDHCEIFTFATYRGTSFYWKKYYSITGTFHNHPNQCESKIEAVYKAVVEFIKWYNEKIKT